MRSTVYTDYTVAKRCWYYTKPFKITFETKDLKPLKYTSLLLLSFDY